MENIEFLSGPFTESGTYDLSASGIDAVNIDWIAGSVRVEPYDGAEIRITEYAQRQLAENEKVRIETSGNTLTIRYRERGANIIRMPEKRIDVFIPRSLSQNMSGLSIDSVSGGIAVDGINAHELKTDSTSGSVTVRNIASRTFSVNTMSGSINVTSATSDRVNMESTSGSITVALVNAVSIDMSSMSGSVRVSDSSAGDFKCETTSGSITVSGAYQNVNLDSISGRTSLDNSQELSSADVNTTSGSIELTGVFDRLDIDSISGSVTVKSRAVPMSLKVNTTSGSINIAVPDSGTITVNHSSVSGRFSSDVSVTMQNGRAQFEISTISGGTKITRLG